VPKVREQYHKFSTFLLFENGANLENFARVMME
jgi:hypothetical protein